MTPNEFNDERKRLSLLIDGGLKALRDATTAYADAERDYRKAKAVAWLGVQAGTAKEREATVDGNTADHRHARDLADGMRKAATESVRSRIQQLSALQSVAAMARADAEVTRYGGGV